MPVVYWPVTVRWWRWSKFERPRSALRFEPVLRDERRPRAPPSVALSSALANVYCACAVKPARRRRRNCPVTPWRVELPFETR